MRTKQTAWQQIPGTWAGNLIASTESCQNSELMIQEIWIDDFVIAWFCTDWGPVNVGEQIQLALFKHYNRCFLMHYLQGVSDAIEVLLVLFRFLSKDFFLQILEMWGWVICSFSLLQFHAKYLALIKRGTSQVNPCEISLCKLEKRLGWRCFTTLTNSATTNMQSWCAAKI